MLNTLKKTSLSKLYYFFSLILCSGCTKTPDGNDAIGKFTSSFQAEIKNNYGFSLYGAGASFPVKIESIDLFFQSDSIASIEEARRLVIPIANRMVDAINRSEYLTPYLSNVPATLKNISLTLNFNEVQNNKTSIQSVMVVGKKKLIFYYTREKDKLKLKEVLEEPFDEAVKILQDEASRTSDEI